MNRTAFANSICAIALADGRQIGFARAARDGAVFARILDVVVWPDLRGKGIGKALVRALLDHPDLSAVNCFMLATADAHGLHAARPLTGPKQAQSLAGAGHLVQG